MRLRFDRRQSQSAAFQFAAPLLSLGLALAVVALFLVAAGVNPFLAYRDVLDEALGSLYAVTETLVQATPLIFTGLGVMLAFRMQLWNIGAEGQLYIGALGATAVALYSGFQSKPVMLTAMMLAAMASGGLWGAIPGALKARYRVNEVIITLLLNYIALGLLNYLVYGPWRDPKGFGFPITAEFSEAGKFATYFDSRLHTGFFLAIALGIVLWIFTEKTIWGYEIRVIGNNPRAAHYAGMSIQAKTIFVMFLSGAFAALAGFTQVAGITGRLQPNLSPGYGFTAVIVAWLARRSALGVLLVSFFFGVIYVGGDALKVTYKLPESFINIFQGMLLFFLLASEFFVNHKLSVVRTEPAAAVPA